MHIGYLNQDFVPEVGAGPARILEMAKRWQELGARVTVIAGMPNRRIPGRGEGTVDPKYAGKLFVEEEWEGVRALRSWVYTGSGRGFANKIVNNASFMATGLLHALLRVPRALWFESPHRWFSYAHGTANDTQTSRPVTFYRA